MAEIKRYYFLLQEKERYYVSDDLGIVYYLYNSKTINNKIKNSPVIWSIFGANVLPHILKAFNFVMVDIKIMSLIFLMVTIFFSIIAGYIYSYNQVKSYKVRLSHMEHLFREQSDAFILNKAYKRIKIIFRTLVFMIGMISVSIIIYMSNHEFIWLFMVSVSIFCAISLFVLYTKTEGNISIDSKSTFDVLKKLKKEGVF